MSFETIWLKPGCYLQTDGVVHCLIEIKKGETNQWNPVWISKHKVFFISQIAITTSFRSNTRQLPYMMKVWHKGFTQFYGWKQTRHVMMLIFYLAASAMYRNTYIVKSSKTIFIVWYCSEIHGLGFG